MTTPDLSRSEAAAALICRRQAGQPQWFARWNRNWRCFFLVGGHRKKSESFRDCLVREIREELGIQENLHFVAPHTAAARVEYDAWSERTKAWTHYVFDLFDVQASAGLQWERADSAEPVRWLSEREVRAGRTDDGQDVSPTMIRLLSSVQWKCPGDTTDR